MKDLNKRLEQLCPKEDDSFSTGWYKHFLRRLSTKLMMVKLLNSEHVSNMDALEGIVKNYSNPSEEDEYDYVRGLNDILLDVIRQSKRSRYHILSGYETQYHVYNALEIVDTYINSLKN